MEAQEKPPLLKTLSDLMTFTIMYGNYSLLVLFCGSDCKMTSYLAQITGSKV